MFDALSNAQRGIIRLATAATVAAVAICWGTRARRNLSAAADVGCEEKQIQTTTHITPLLREAARQFFSVCLAVQINAVRLRKQIKDNKVQITEERLRELLAGKCQIRDQLKHILEDVLACDFSTIQKIQAKFAQDREVAVIFDGIEGMLQSALGGVPPVLPEVVIPDALTEEVAMQLLIDTFVLERQKVLEEVGGQQITEKVLKQILCNARRQACNELVAERIPELKDSQSIFETFYSALCLYTLGSKRFATRRQEVEEEHHKEKTLIFSRPASSASIPPAPADNTGLAGGLDTNKVQPSDSFRNEHNFEALGEYSVFEKPDR